MENLQKKTCFSSDKLNTFGQSSYLSIEIICEPILKLTLYRVLLSKQTEIVWQLIMCSQYSTVAILVKLRTTSSTEYLLYI